MTQRCPADVSAGLAINHEPTPHARPNLALGNRIANARFPLPIRDVFK